MNWVVNWVMNWVLNRVMNWVMNWIMNWVMNGAIKRAMNWAWSTPAGEAPAFLTESILHLIMLFSFWNVTPFAFAYSMCFGKQRCRCVILFSSISSIILISSIQRFFNRFMVFTFLVDIELFILKSVIVVRAIFAHHIVTSFILFAQISCSNLFIPKFP